MHNRVFQVTLKGLLSKYKHDYLPSDILTATNILYGNLNSCFKVQFTLSSLKSLICYNSPILSNENTVCFPSLNKHSFSKSLKHGLKIN